jgi:hypothetical protein
MHGILGGVLLTLPVLFLLRAIGFLAWRRGVRRGGRWRGRGWMLRRLFARLETTPGQERLLLEELDRLRAELAGLREGLFASREELAATLAAERLDPSALEALVARQLARAEAARKAAVDGLSRFHEALTARQRQVLAQLVRSGRLGPAHGRC